jgi:hypothetical protein
MVKLSNSKPKSGGEAQTRILGNEKLGYLLSQVQSAMIRSGNELEELIREAISEENLITLDTLKTTMRNTEDKIPSIQVVYKPSRPDPINSSKTIQADFLIVDNVSKHFTLIEIKDGHEFDTKKSSAELKNLRDITSWLAQEFPYSANFYICGFNQEDKETIINGLKRRFTEEQVLTGRELCQKMKIDYDAIRERRKADQVQNRMYFLRKLLEIEDIRSEIRAILDEVET